MALPLIIGGLGLAEGFLGYASAYSESESLKLRAESARIRGEFAAAAEKRNARISDIQAEEAQARGRKVASDIYRKARLIKGSNRAAAAASGIAIDSGSIADIQDETSKISELDMLTANNNAWKEAWGLKVQAQDQRFNAEQMLLESKAEAAAYKGKASATMLGGYGSLIGGGVKGFSGFSR